MAVVWCLWIGILSVLLQVGGFVSPGWLRVYLDTRTTMIEVGLWYWCSDNTCELRVKIDDERVGGIIDTGKQIATNISIFLLM